MRGSPPIRAAEMASDPRALGAGTQLAFPESAGAGRPDAHKSCLGSPVGLEPGYGLCEASRCRSRHGQCRAQQACAFGNGSGRSRRACRCDPCRRDKPCGDRRRPDQSAASRRAHLSGRPHPDRAARPRSRHRQLRLAAAPLGSKATPTPRRSSPIGAGSFSAI